MNKYIVIGVLLSFITSVYSQDTTNARLEQLFLKIKSDTTFKRDFSGRPLTQYSKEGNGPIRILQLSPDGKTMYFITMLAPNHDSILYLDYGLNGEIEELNLYVIPGRTEIYPLEHVLPTHVLKALDSNQCLEHHYLNIDSVHMYIIETHSRKYKNKIIQVEKVYIYNYRTNGSGKKLIYKRKRYINQPYSFQLFIKQYIDMIR